MQFLNKSLLLALQNNLDGKTIQDFSASYFNDIFDFFKQDKVLHDYYDKYYKDTFPIFQVSNQRLILSLNPFNVMKIKTISNDNLDVIRNNLNTIVLTTKSYTDNFSEDRELLKVSNSLQNTTYKNNYINYSFLNASSQNFKIDHNLLNDILNENNLPIVNSSVSNYNSVDIFLLFQSLQYLFATSTNFYNVMVNNLYASNNINKSLLKNDFFTFINNNNQMTGFDDSLYKSFSSFVLKNTFNIFAPSKTLKKKLEDFIKTEIYADLNNTFDSFIDNSLTDDLKKLFNTKYINIIRNQVFYIIFKELLKNNIEDFFDSEATRDNRFDSIFCEKYINDFLNENKTENNLKQYLMPIYLYKNEPVKFLNSIQPFMMLYFEQELKSKLKYTGEYRYRVETKSVLKSLLNQLDIDSINSYFESFDIFDICNDNNIPQFISFLFGNDIIQEFCNSDEFDTFIISLLNKINTYLYNERLIRYNMNWYTNIELIKHYFLSYFLKYTCIEKNDRRQNILFSNLEDNISTLLDSSLAYTSTNNEANYLFNALSSNRAIVDSTYQFCGNLLESAVTRQVYFQVLSYFAND